MFRRIPAPSSARHSSHSNEENSKINHNLFKELDESKQRSPSPLDWLNTITFNLNEKQQLWKLFIDFCKQPIEGWQGFEEREPGYLAGMKQAFLNMLATYEEDLSVDLVKTFHY